MPAVLANSPHSGLAVNLRQWRELAAQVRDYEPQVVVLIARKAPRVRQALALDFGAGALTVSDLALPFLGTTCSGMRVAVVDDVVNVGSTVRTTYEKVTAAGADDVRVFAIAHRPGNELADIPVSYVSDDPLDDVELRRFASRIPDELQGLAKPYDLDFPLLRCRLQSERHQFGDILQFLKDRYGEGRSWDLTSARGAALGVRRAAVDMETGTHDKVRLYVDAAGCVNLVPIAVSPVLPTEEPRGKSAQALWSEVAPAARAENLEALARLRLFCDSLSLGTRFMAENADWLSQAPEPLDLDEAELIFGPRVRRFSLGHLTEVDASESRPRPTASTPSPFLAYAEEMNFSERILKRTGNGDRPDVLSLFIAIFDELAELVGASDPSKFQWPAPSAKAIRENSYLRLRIGPTAYDLIDLIREASGRQSPPEVTRQQVSRLLDRFIDAGSVVPTTTTQDGRVYRIYRKGESDHKVAVADRIHFALTNYDRPITRTRLAKVMAALSFNDQDDSMLEVKNLTRGNVPAFRDDLLNAGSDVTAWLRDNGHIRRASE